MDANGGQAALPAFPSFRVHGILHVFSTTVLPDGGSGGGKWRPGSGGGAYSIKGELHGDTNGEPVWTALCEARLCITWRTCIFFCGGDGDRIRGQ
eukprot:10501372-Prorocentrum_lima.AAC.1